MIYFAFFILFFGLIRMMVALVNLITRVGFPQKINPDYKPFVSVLIPARNEENNIGGLLTDLANFSYPHFEVIVYDDNSTDNTATIVDNFVRKNSKIQLIEGSELPTGWLGKNNGCHKLAENARGDLFLFLDADVRVKNTFIEKLISYQHKYKLSLLSVFPMQLMPVPETRKAVPLMNWILLSLLPLVLIRLSSWKSFSAANGQCMLFDAGMYKKLKPHEQFRNNPVEDIEILRYFKKQKLKTATLLGDEHIKCTMYQSLDEAVNGFSKNVFRFFGGSATVTVFFGMFTTLAPVLAIVTGGWKFLIAYIVIIILIRIFMSLASKQNVAQNLLLMPVQQYVFMKIIYNALKQRKNKSLIWKNRKILSDY